LIRKEWWSNYRAGIVAAAIYNVNRNINIHPDEIDPMMFFTPKEEPVEPTLEELAAGIDYTLRMAAAGWKP
jgi:hypothetical protein